VPTEIIYMTEIDYCICCGKHIGNGNDPAICDSEGCKNNYWLECEFNKWAAEQAGKDE
jgi:hypothetical protein